MRVAVAQFALVAVLLGACSTGTEPPQGLPSEGTPAAASGGPSEPAPSEPATPSDDEPVASCGPTTAVPEQSGSHLVGDNEPPVPYNSTPPTSGWHSSGSVAIRVHDEPLTEPEQVSVLEAGGAVVSYGTLPRPDVAKLARLVRRHYDGRVALTPYKKLDRGQVALTAWATLRLCDGVDLRAVRRFADTHADQVGEPGH